jgi:hypothetical protein
MARLELDELFAPIPANHRRRVRVIGRVRIIRIPACDPSELGPELSRPFVPRADIASRAMHARARRGGITKDELLDALSLPSAWHFAGF